MPSSPRLRPQLGESEANVREYATGCGTVQIKFPKNMEIYIRPGQYMVILTHGANSSALRHKGSK
jgi:hypothetical protein